MRGQRQESDREWLRRRLVHQLKTQEQPTLLQDVAPDVALSLLAELLQEQAQRDQRSLRWRWVRHQEKELDLTAVLACLLCLPIGLMVLWERGRRVNHSIFYVHTSEWYRLSKLLIASAQETRSAAGVATLLTTLRQLDSDRTREEQALETALARRVADILPFLPPEQLHTLPLGAWQFLHLALNKRLQVDKLERLPWMKADFVIAALFALTATGQRQVSSLVRALAESDSDERVREAAWDYLAAHTPAGRSRSTE